MFKLLRILLRLTSVLTRIAEALEESVGTLKKKKLKAEDFALYSRTEEEIVMEEDELFSAAIRERMKSIRPDEQTFFLEDNIRDITDEINES